MVANIPNSLPFLQKSPTDDSLYQLRQNILTMYNFIAKAINGPSSSIGPIPVPPNAAEGTVVANYYVGYGLSYNLYLNTAGTQWLYLANGPGTILEINAGSASAAEFIWYIAPPGTAGQPASPNPYMTLSAGQLGVIGSASASSFTAAGSTYAGSATVAGTVQAGAGRIISVNTGNQPTISLWDMAVGAGGLYSEVGTGRICFAQMDAAGDAIAGLGGMDRGGSFQANGNITAYGSLISNNSVYANGPGGVWFQDNQGWFYTGQNFCAGGAISPSNQFAGVYFSINAGWMWCTGNFFAPVVGVTQGIYWQNNGGWMYSPNGVWCANINTGPIQCNGQAVEGVSALYTNGSYYGGWGAQYAWTGNGNWVAFQATDALYAYNNQSLAGGLIWTICDERTKWNFRPVERDCLAAINAIQLRSFDFSEGGFPQRKVNPWELDPKLIQWEDAPRKVKHFETGFIAQQLREVIPEAVPDPPEEGGILSADMRPLVATLIGAVQQLTARLTALEGK